MSAPPVTDPAAPPGAGGPGADPSPPGAGPGPQPGSADAGRAKGGTDAAASAEPPPAAEPPQDELPQGEADEWSHARRVYYNVTNNNFHAEVDAGQATFGGPGGRPGTRRATGLLGRDDVEAALTGFVPPAGFDAAYATLAEEHLVVLVGDDGSGRRTGALALVCRASGAGGAITSMSPAYGFADLAGRARFEHGRGYLVQDHIGDESVAVREFECGRLAARLRSDGAYLVVTATPTVIAHGTLRRYVHRWRCPDLTELFETAAREAGLTEPALGTARGVVGQLTTPHEVVAFVRRVAADPTAAGDAMGNAAREQVTRWFDELPGRRDVMALAVLTFLHGVPERTFEGLLARLLELSDDEPDKTDALPQRRAAIARDHPLLAAQRATMIGANGLVSERAVMFHSAQHHRQVMAELCDRYGYELWEPLRHWLDEVAASDDSAALVQLALGMALLAEVSFGEVADFLDRWADGLASERLTAAIALWGMCARDGLEPLALQLAIGWVRDRGPRRAVTAAMALGGDLGLRYPSDALRWLWFLARRSERVGAVARLSIGALFAAGVDDPDRCAAMFSQARENVRTAMHADAGSDQRELRAVRNAVVSLLSTPRIDAVEPAVATVVRGRAGVVGALGGLWADALCSAPHRLGAFHALVECIDAVERASGATAAGHLGRFGSALLAPMQPWQRDVLHRDLAHADVEPRLVAALFGSTHPRAFAEEGPVDDR